MHALACRRVVLFTKEMSIFRADFEGDAELITKALWSRDTSNLEFGHILYDSLVLASDLRVCFFLSCKKNRQLCCPFSS